MAPAQPSEMAGPVLAIDAGSTSVRALVVDADLEVLGRAQVRADVSTPLRDASNRMPSNCGRPREAVIGLALSDAGIRTRRAIAAIGITAQRGNVVMWDAKTGTPVAPLVSWQDTRGTARAAELIAQGFLRQPSDGGGKDSNRCSTRSNAVANAFDRGALLWGNSTPISRGASPAVRYLRDWITARRARPATTTTSRASGIRALIEAQGLDARRFPALSETMRHFGDTAVGVFGARCPITRSSRTSRARPSRKAACFRAIEGTLRHRRRARRQHRHRTDARERVPIRWCCGRATVCGRSASKAW